MAHSALYISKVLNFSSNINLKIFYSELCFDFSVFCLIREPMPKLPNKAITPEMIDGTGLDFMISTIISCLPDVIKTVSRHQ